MFSCCLSDAQPKDKQPNKEGDSSGGHFFALLWFLIEDSVTAGCYSEMRRTWSASAAVRRHESSPTPALQSLLCPSRCSQRSKPLNELGADLMVMTEPINPPFQEKHRTETEP